MQENVGGRDLVLRSLAGPAMLLAALGPLGARRGSTLGLATLVSGALLAESAITRVCPLNALFGLDTKR